MSAMEEKHKSKKDQNIADSFRFEKHFTLLCFRLKSLGYFSLRFILSKSKIMLKEVFLLCLISMASANFKDKVEELARKMCGQAFCKFFTILIKIKTQNGIPILRNKFFWFFGPLRPLCNNGTTPSI